jgi:hypothetical protein
VSSTAILGRAREVWRRWEKSTSCVQHSGDWLGARPQWDARRG